MGGGVTPPPTPPLMCAPDDNTFVHDHCNDKRGGGTELLSLKTFTNDLVIDNVVGNRLINVCLNYKASREYYCEGYLQTTRI